MDEPTSNSMNFSYKIAALVLGLLFCLRLEGQSRLEQINDSIMKYKFIDTNYALEFGYSALDDNDLNNPSKELVTTHYLIAETLYTSGYISQALEFLASALKVYQVLSDEDRAFSKVSEPPWILVLMGNIFFHSNEFEQAEEFYELAWTNFDLIGDENQSQRIFGHNTTEGNLALIALEQRDFAKAENYFNSIYQRNLKLNRPQDLMYSNLQFMRLNLVRGNYLEADKHLNAVTTQFNEIKKKNDLALISEFSLFAGLTYYFYGAYWVNERNFGEAISYLEKSLPLLKNSRIDYYTSAITLIEAYVQNEKYALAIKAANKLLKEPSLSVRQKREVYVLLLKSYEAESNDFQLNAVKDTIIALGLIDQDKTMSLGFNYLENELILNRKQQEINEEKLRLNRVIYLLIIGLLLATFLTLSFRFLYKLQNEKAARLEAEKNLTEKELSLKKRELVSKTNFISQRNDYLVRLKKDLEENPSNLSWQNFKSQINQLVRGEQVYAEFEKSFTEVYPDFFEQLNKRVKLSKTDLRLAAFIRLKHTTSEIAQISGVSVRTIESQRYRLSKKLELEKGEDLNAYLLRL